MRATGGGYERRETQEEETALTEPFLLSVPSCEPVEIEPFHYAIVGQTQFSGKTTLLKRLATWATADQGFKVLVFDTKETVEDYTDFGPEIPVCLRETTDSFVLIGLLESMFKRRLTPYYATLSRLTEAAKGFDDIIKRAKEAEAKTKSPWLRDAYRVIYDLLERLKAETSKVETVPKLELNDGLNRMVINDFSLEAQQLIVKNAFEDALRVYKQNLIIILDEAFKFLPQGYSSPATRAVMTVITQGAKTGLYTWISTQFLAITDKDPLKACAIKFLGTQDHITEVKHTLDLIPEARAKFSTDDIMTLKLGQWILVRKRPPDVRLVYAVPVGVPLDEGRKVASGMETPEYIRDTYLKKKEVNEELIFKEKYEKLEAEYESLQKELRDLAETASEDKKRLIENYEKKIGEERQKAFREAMQKVDEIKSQWNIQEYQETIMKLKDEVNSLKNRLENADKIAKTVQDLREVLWNIIEPRVQIPVRSEPGPSEISVTSEQPAISLKVGRKKLTLTDRDLEGKISILYAEGNLPSDKWFTVTDVAKAFEAHGWSKDPRASKVLDQFCQWNFLEKGHFGKRPQYKLKIKLEDAKAKGLLKVEE